MQLLDHVWRSLCMERRVSFLLLFLDWGSRSAIAAIAPKVPKATSPISSSIFFVPTVDNPTVESSRELQERHYATSLK